MVLGIDEAGRGAAIGPFIVAGVLVPRGQLAALSELGARDSKQLARPRRAEILRRLIRYYPARVRVIPASRVDEASLTELELTAAAELIGWARKFASSRELEVVMDAPATRRAIPSFLARLARATGMPPASLAAFPKADVLHPAVAAASIAAKVARDAHVVFLRAIYGDFGWGYPGERRVQEFLAGWLSRRGRLPPIVRTRWGSVAALLERRLTF